MSCSRSNLKNLDTRIYNTNPCGCGCDDQNLTIQIIDRGTPFCPWYPPFPPVPPTPTPVVIPTNSYAYFFSNAATGATYTAGSTIPISATSANTDTAGIVNNNGVLTLSGGTTGRSYLINYKLTGSTTAATVGLAINGVNDTSTNSSINDAATSLNTVSGSYILTVPANTVSTVSLNVVTGSITTPTPATGTNISVIRIA